MFRRNDSLDSPAHVESALHDHLAGRNGGDEVIQDEIGDRFVKMALVPESPEIEFEGLEFDAKFMGHIVHPYRREVWLSCFRTHTGELRALEIDLVVSPWSGIRKGLKVFAGLGRHANECP